MRRNGVFLLAKHFLYDIECRGKRTGLLIGGRCKSVGTRELIFLLDDLFDGVRERIRHQSVQDHFADGSLAIMRFTP